MRRPPGGGLRTTTTSTSKTLTTSRASNPVIETRRPGSEPLGDPEYWADPTTQPPTPVKRVRMDTRPFLNASLERVSNPGHPLHKALVVEVTGPDGNPTYAWRTTTLTTQKGEEKTGRYAGAEHGIVVQVGNRDAFASGAPEILMLEDADPNQYSGQTIESKGPIS
jgi:hypothetical protein